MVNFCYLSQHGAEKLKSYSFKARDNSLLLKYVTNPIYTEVSRWLPNWLAPNLITLLGLICATLGFGVILAHNPRLDGPAPQWTYLLEAWAIMSYQALDAIDGKQARRTGSSSALGMMFDHGCDALNTTISSVALCATFRLESGFTSFIFWFSAILVFYGATLEEFYTGELRLGAFNGPNEGLAIVSALNVATALYGSQFWMTDYFGFGFDCRMIYLGIVLFGSSLMIIENSLYIYSAIRIHGSKKRIEALTRPIPFCTIVLLCMLWAYISPTQILSRNAVTLMVSLGLMFSKTVTQLMICHVCHEDYHPVGKTMLSWLVCVSLVVVDIWLFRTEFKGLWLNEDAVLWGLFLITTLTYTHLAVQGIREFKEVLGIHCFSIAKRLPT